MDAARSQIKETRRLGVDDVIKALRIINSPIETPKNEFTQFENKELFEDMIALDNSRVKMNSQICKRTYFDGDSQSFDLRLLTQSNAITILHVKLIIKRLLPTTRELRLLYARIEYVKKKNTSRERTLSV
ncbi:hypothetical protein LXL04_023344 [Taraxacum kok-saghyz]